MARTRHEEYFGLKSVPFKFFWKLFRTKAHAGDPANWHENLEIQYCNEGEGYFLLDGQRHLIKAGDVMVANSNSIHFTGTNSEITFSVIIVDSQFCRDIDIDHTKLSFESVIKSEKIVDIFKRIKEVTDSDDPCKTAVCRMLILELLIELRRNHLVMESKQVNEKSYFKAVKDAVTYIQKNYAEHITLDSIASTLFVDKYNLARKFKEQTGTTIISFVNTLRCNNAKILILEGVSIHEAARACGFNNMSFFTKTFKKYIGKAPSEFKPHHR